MNQVMRIVLREGDEYTLEQLAAQFNAQDLIGREVPESFPETCFKELVNLKLSKASSTDE